MANHLEFVVIDDDDDEDLQVNLNGLVSNLPIGLCPVAMVRFSRGIAHSIEHVT